MSEETVTEGGDAGTVLTSDERKTLRVALESGYFEVPRRISTVELAEKVGLTDQKVLEHTRLGTGKLLREFEWDGQANDSQE